MAQARGDAGLTEYRFASEDAITDGLFILDGPVLERFGFGHEEAHRVHLGLVDQVELVEKGGRTYLRLAGTVGFQTMAQPLEADDPQIQELFAGVQAAAGGG